jgi:hypothetical protein
MEKNVQDLIDSYSFLDGQVDSLEKQLEATRVAARETLTELYNEVGSGPINVNGKEVAILIRRGTIQTMPTKRNRKPKVAASVKLPDPEAEEYLETEDLEAV